MDEISRFLLIPSPFEIDCKLPAQQLCSADGRVSELPEVFDSFSRCGGSSQFLFIGHQHIISTILSEFDGDHFFTATL